MYLRSKVSSAVGVVLMHLTTGQVVICHISQDPPQPLPPHVHILQTAAIRLQGSHLYSNAPDMVPKTYSRSRIFSRFHGLLFIGVAFGPTLGSLAERLYGNPYVVFYLALGLHAVNALFTWFIVPESLLPAQMDAARRTRRGSGANWFSRMFSFLSPLAVFAPFPRKGDAPPQEDPQKDWSLTWLALSFAPESLILGGLQYTLQYAIGKFNWSTEIVRMLLKQL
jgi:hypothetical protein